ncbi:protein SMAX1-LIKE 4-like [Cornus florida]|uniref:protein SMAX1-LIKE 4-like n=1 Tax=Cornus florida TaxID=4283 RepID=UPI0028A0BED4|nr:protein SMAX1-LIKE 4-like [Cornus florida]
MRTGANTVHQTFTLEAASILKHSLSWARRRGHAQLTPLHVAATLLTSKTSVHLRRACLKSQPHQTPHYPLHCRALELSFNVALNRLPTTPYQHLHTQPSLSNALIAALKRAQAHQRRGFVEQRQQQPLLSMKVELKQLILSILDDPSVSRVLREVGFSSIAVKNNLESYSSFEPTPFRFFHQNKHPNSLITDSASVEEDIKLVLEVVLRKKRRNTVIVGDSEVRTEGLVEELMSRVERKEVPEELKSAHLIRFQFSSLPLRFMKREEVEMNLLDLKRKVDSVVSRGMRVIIYIGDLKWTLDRTDYEKEGGGSSVYRVVEHLVAEIGRLVCEYSSSSSTMNVWLMGIASYQTYMKCQMKQPSLEIQWALQAVSVPSGGLGLSLHSTSVHESRINFSQNLSQMPETKPFINDDEQDKLVCCAECTSNYEKEARLFKSSHHQTPSSLCLSSCNTKEFDECSTPLPYWLQSHNIRPQQKDDLAELRRKWNRMCHSFHQMNSTMKPDQCVNSLPRFQHHESCHNGLNFSNGNQKCRLTDPNLNCFENTEAGEVKITLAFGNSVFLNREKFAALGNEKIVQHGKVCELERDASWHSEVVPSIIEDLINSRSIKKDRWFLIEGNDSVEKRRLASEIGESMFGSADFLLFYMNMKNGDYSSTSSENLQSALRNHEKLVVVMEDVDFSDTRLVKFLAGGFETGKLGELSKEEESSCRAIFILTKGDPKSNEGDKKNPNSVMLMKLQVTIPNLGRDSLDHKRKAEWDLAGKAKSPRIDERDEASSIAADCGNSEKEFTRQLSSNTIDLNIRPDQDEVNRGSVGELSSISSD